jgi:uncharacterized membrane protein
MTFTYTVVAHFPFHIGAETVVRELQEEGFDMRKLSIIGKDYQTNEHVRGFLSWKDTAKTGATGGGYWGSFVGGLLGILAGAGVIFIPGMAPLIIAGLITGVLAWWLEGTLVGGVTWCICQFWTCNGLYAERLARCSRRGCPAQRSQIR